MSKIIRATITYDIYPDENGFLEWDDKEDGGRTDEELIEYAKQDMYELIMNGAKYNDIYNMIDVEIVGG